MQYGSLLLPREDGVAFGVIIAQPVAGAEGHVFEVFEGAVGLGISREVMVERVGPPLHASWPAT